MAIRGSLSTVSSLLLGDRDRAIRLLTGALTVYCAVVAVLLAFPFNFAVPRLSVENMVQWDRTDSGLVFAAPGMVRSVRPPHELGERLARGPGLTVEIWATPYTLAQDGPARIVSYSRDPWHRNLTLGQVGADLVIRLRTTRTNANGTSPSLKVRDVFEANKERHIVVTYDLERQRVYVDGKLRRAAKIPGGDLTAWDPGHTLVLGNELTGDRPWLGALRAVAFYDRAIDSGAARSHRRAPATGSAADARPVAAFDFAGPSRSAFLPASSLSQPIRLKRPERIGNGGVRILSVLVDGQRRPSLRERLYPLDFVENIVLFMPFGALLFMLLTGRGRSAYAATAWTLGAAMAFSLTAELSQVFLASRDSSLYDVVSNTAGAALAAGGLSVMRRFGRDFLPRGNV